MTSSVHFKFKSQKEPSRVSFDGTGISVFELKREIINQNRLGDGSEFELAIYNEDTNKEYDDDTAIIPRSTSVIARRFPAMRAGKGGAARYMSGKMPVMTRIPSRANGEIANLPINNISQNMSDLGNLQSEDEKIKALFHLQESQWKEQQQDMATATPALLNRSRGKATVVPEHAPPPGYLCYRCREKGHWIQACPTNNDPKFDGRYRVKRSTGIPRSFQKQVDKPESLEIDGSNEDLKLSGVMVNADGDFVIAQPDKASWEIYQEKAKTSKQANSGVTALESNKQLYDRGLLCPLDNRMLLAPTKTPCCGKTYCNDCITNALIESDFVCPNCSAEGVLLDNLHVDEEATTRLRNFESEKAHQVKEGEQKNNAPVGNTLLPVHSTSSQPGSSKEHSTLPKKRPATENLENEEAEIQAIPVAKKPKPQERAETLQTTTRPVSMGLHSSAPFPGQTMPIIPFPSQEPVPLSRQYHVSDGWSRPEGPYMIPANSGPFQNTFNHQVSAGEYGPSIPSVNFGYSSHYMSGVSQPSSLRQPYELATFSNQQRNTSSEPFAKEEDTPYMRQPVNPHRHQGRQKRTRPSDYREL